MHKDPRLHRLVLVLLLAAATAAVAGAGEWTHWRGPEQTGVSPETGLVSSWSKDGTNLIWRADFTGRSTPIVFDGRACAIGRAGEGISRQEVVACWDAGTGAKLWERRFDVYNTAVPWNRVGWASMAGDSETGYLYAQHVAGRFTAFDRDGNVAWFWELGEDLGRFSGYGGRTNTPIVDEDRVIVHIINAGWGKDFGPAGDRYVAFDKRTGEVQWVSANLGRPDDLNTCSSPVVAEVGGRRLLIAGGSSGWIYAIEARTGREVWRFHLSLRGLNSSVVAAGDRVYAAQSEENVDNAVMGRVVAIDATGSGDVTTSHEVWRADGLGVGYASPLVHDGTLYVVDNAANLVALDAGTGAKRWEWSSGTVGKDSPVWADGKIFLTEVNGNVHILEPKADGVKDLDSEHLEMPGGHRHAEIYASPAIAYGRLYLVTEEGIYCIGDESKPFVATASMSPKAAAPAPEGAKPATLLVVPAIVVAKADEGQSFRARLYDGHGRFIRETAAEWSVAGVPGTIADGRLAVDAAKVSGTLTGAVTAKADGLTGTAYLRIAGALPWSQDFEDVEVGKWPSGWMGVARKGSVQEVGGSKVLALVKPHGGVPRARVNLGPSFLSGYTIQADLQGTQEGRRRSDVGLLNSGYTADLQGNHQRLQIRSWESEFRMMKQRDFAWEPGVWYTMKLRVDYEGAGDAAKAIVRAKVWKRGEAEPGEWTFTAEDPLPIREGNPGLYAFTPVDAYFDNVKIEVTR